MTPYRLPQTETGLALVAVLGLVALLGVMAVGILEITQRHGQMLVRSIELSQAQQTADSAIRLTLLELTNPSGGVATGASKNITGRRTVNVFGRAVTVTIELETGRIDLNFADKELLFAFFAANDVPQEQALEFADRIVDWRDLDDERQPEGAERADYRRAGRRFGPRNAPFETVSELKQVIGLEDISDELLNGFTVYSHLSDVRQGAAPAPVLRALRWAEQKNLKERRWLGEIDADSELSPQSLLGTAARITSCLTVADFDACRVAVIRLTGNQSRPKQTLLWQTAYR